MSEASGHLKKVEEGSRQNGSVTLGKGVALRVGRRCLTPYTNTEQMLLGVIRCPAESCAAAVHGWNVPSLKAFLCGERLPQNWSGQGESDCLIKTKHCAARNQ